MLILMKHRVKMASQKKKSEVKRYKKKSIDEKDYEIKDR